MSVGEGRRPLNAGERLAMDFGPLATFFLANAFMPVAADQRIYWATGAFMAATALAMIFSLTRAGRISPMLWFSGAMVLVFGGLTIWLHDETFIKVKPTLIYLFLAGMLAFGLLTGRPTLRIVLESAYPGLSDRGWHLLTRNWAWFFVAMAAANEAVWRLTDTDFWVGYKLWGALPLTIAFAALNIPMLLRNGLSEKAAGDDAKAMPPQG